MNAQNLTTFLIVSLLNFSLSGLQPQCSAAAPDELLQAMAALDAELQSDPVRRDRWREALQMDRLEETWRKKLSLEELRGRVVRLKFYLRSAKLYSFVVRD